MRGNWASHICLSVHTHTAKHEVVLPPCFPVVNLPDRLVIQQRELAEKESIVAKRKSDNAGSEIPVEHKWSARRTS